MKKKAVIFDMDGVLADTEPVYFNLNRRMFRALGVEVSDEEQAEYVGLAAHEMWSRVKECHNLSQAVDDLVEMEKREQAREMASVPHLRRIPGVIDLIEALRKRGIRIGVATGASQRVLDLVLSRTGLGNEFDTVVSSEDVSRGKPNPDIYLEAAAKLGTPPAQCLAIEDSPHGIAAAKAAGMTVIGFQNTNSGDQNLSAADLIVHSFSHKENERILGTFNSP